MKRILLVLCAMTLLGGVISAAPVSAEAAPYRPGNGVVFNNPRASKAKQLTIITQINRSIDGSPRGSTIHMAQYLFDINSVADKLIAAHRRGVNVRVLIDDGEQNKQAKRVKKVLGTNKRARSFVATCKRGCMSDIASVMHAKFYLFSRVGTANRVSMVSSANPYSGNTYTSWNNNHTIVGDVAIYNSLVKYFNDMILDRTNRNYYRETTSGKYKLYLFPRGPRKGVQIVVPIDVLNHVACSGVARGYGSKGRTVVRIAMWGWTYGRLDLAKKVWDLHNRGCKVEVILNKGRTNPRVIAALLKKSKRGRLPVHDAWKDKNKNGKPEVYMHHKLLAINGRWFGHPNTKVVYTGSANFSAPATLTNNDIVLRIKDNATYNAYSRNLDYIRKKHTKKITRVPSSSRSLSILTADGRVVQQQSRNTEDEFDEVLDR